MAKPFATANVDSSVFSAYGKVEQVQGNCTMIDRSEVNRALAKALAYKGCGEEGKAHDWAVRLVELLECHGILNDDARIARNQRLGARP